MGRVLSHDPATKMVEKFHWDEVNEQFVIESRQDISQCVELTQAEFNTFGKKAAWKGDFHKVASVPLTVVADLTRRGIWQDDDALKKWLSDRDHLKFRARPGRLA